MEKRPLVDAQPCTDAGPPSGREDRPVKRQRVDENGSDITKFSHSAPAAAEANGASNTRTDSPDGDASQPETEPRDSTRKLLNSFKSKRPSSVNLHNHPTDPHPVGLAIWLLQRIDQARKQASADEERSQSPSVASSPKTPPSYWQLTQPNCPPNGLGPTSGPYSAAKTLDGGPPFWGHVPQNTSEDVSIRLQAQRERKTKQRAENWAKSKFCPAHSDSLCSNPTSPR